MRGVWLIPFAVIAAGAEVGNSYWGGQDGTAAGAGAGSLGGNRSDSDHGS